MAQPAETDLPLPLLEGERIIWSGKPCQGLLLTPSDALLIPFSLLWAGFVVYWESNALRHDVPLLFRLWGIPFIIMGLYMLVGRFVVDAWLRGKTRYAVTNRRILIARSDPWGSLTALSLDQLPEMHISQQARGRGTLRFGQPAASPIGWGTQGGKGSLSPALDPTPQFIGIENAADVFNQIQAALRGTP